MVNIILIGFMGVGKSTIGRALAEQLSWNFLDSDDKIEEIVGTDIPDIFHTYGEEYFRRLEFEVLSNMIDQSGVIISTGGGAVMNKRLFDMLLAKSLVIHLDASLETLYHRLKGASNRPMLYHDDLKKRIGELYNLRHPTYMKAHYTIKTDGKSEEQITNEILQIIRRGENRYCY